MFARPGFQWFSSCLKPWLILLALTVSPAGSAAAADTAWFGISGEQAVKWQIIPISPDGMHLTVTRADQADKPGPKILVLYPRASSAYNVAMNSLLGQFAERMPLARFDIRNYENHTETGKAILQDAVSSGTRLIFAMGSETAAFVLKNFQGRSIPIVTICAKDPVLLGQIADYEHGSGTNIAFTSLNVPIEVQLTYLASLRPNLKNLAILVDSKNISAVETQAQPIMLAARQRGIRVIEAAVDHPEAVEADLAQLLPKAVASLRETDPDLTHSLFWMTGSTSLFNEITMINQLIGKIPLISAVPDLVRTGDDSAVLSIGIGFQTNGQMAAHYGIDILQGRALPGSLKVGVVSPPDIAINFKRAQAIGLKIPFSFFEAASFIYDHDGRLVRDKGQSIAQGG